MDLLRLNESSAAQTENLQQSSQERAESMRHSPDRKPSAEGNRTKPSLPWKQELEMHEWGAGSVFERSPGDPTVGHQKEVRSEAEIADWGWPRVSDFSKRTGALRAWCLGSMDGLLGSLRLLL